MVGTEKASVASEAVPAASKTVVYLHVGTPKSGTTYLQNILWRNRDALRSAGVLYPGEAHQSHFLAAIDQQRIDFRGYRDPRAVGAWESLVRAAREWPETVVISHEIFSAAPTERARAALADLDFAEVHLVLTTRDLARQIPAAWQEDLKNRYTMGLSDYVDAVRERGDMEQASGFWRMQDPADILRRWAADVPPERVHVVTVPPPGSPPDLLWERFASVIGFDPEVCDRSSVPANPGLGTVEAALLRRINQRLDTGEIDWPTYEMFVKFRLAERGLAGRDRRQPVRLPESEHAWVAEWSRELVGELTERGYAVTGDLDELLPAEPGTMDPHPDDAGSDAMLEASLDGLSFLLRQLMDQRRRLMNRASEVEKLSRDLEETRGLLDEARQATQGVRRELGRELEEAHRRQAETHQAFIAAFERPVWRHAAYRTARWLPPIRRLLRWGVRMRQRRANKAAEKARASEQAEAPERAGLAEQTGLSQQTGVENSR